MKPRQLSDHLCECGCGEYTDIIPKHNRCLGQVKGQPFRFLPRHAPRAHLQGAPNYREEDRGYRTPCWIWNLFKNARGYGRHRMGGKRGQAHRLYWEAENGSVPDGFELDHLCRSRDCVRPDHLEVVTHAENARRGAIAKLSMDAARAIRSRPDELLRVLGAEYGVSISTISLIRRNRIWREDMA